MSESPSSSTRLKKPRSDLAELAETVETQNRELTIMEADRDKWKRIAGDAKAIGEVAPGSKAGHERAVATAREMEALNSEIASLCKRPCAIYEKTTDECASRSRRI